MPVILDPDSDPESVVHSDTDETDSEINGEEGNLEESDTDTEAEYSYHIEDNDDEDEMDFDDEGNAGGAGDAGDAGEPGQNPGNEMGNDNNPSSSSSSSPSTFSTPSQKSPSPPPSSRSKCSTIQMVFYQLASVFVIYLKFAVLAVLIYSVVLWYALNFTDLDAELGSKSSTVSEDKDSSDTCPAGLVA